MGSNKWGQIKLFSEYPSLGKGKKERTTAYRALFNTHVGGKLIRVIRESVKEGLALGNEHFKDEVEALYGRRLRPAKMGRPAKSLI